MLKTARKLLAASLVALGAGHAGPALAVFAVNDTFLDGSFDQVAYGNGMGGAFITPFLFSTDLGNTQAAATQVMGAGINYSYALTGNGTSVLGLSYHFQNVRDPGSLFPNVTGLRFMLSVLAVGDVNTFSPADQASQNWPAKVAGDPDKRQIEDLNQNSLNSLIVNNNGLTDGANNCGMLGCTAQLGLEWDLAQLTPGQSWDIHLRLLDSAALVAGGRYLRANSLDVPGNLLVVGNPLLIPEPEVYALLLAGFAALALRRRRALSRAP